MDGASKGKAQRTKSGSCGAQVRVRLHRNADAIRDRCGRVALQREERWDVLTFGDVATRFYASEVCARTPSMKSNLIVGSEHLSEHCIPLNYRFIDIFFEEANSTPAGADAINGASCSW